MTGQLVTSVQVDLMTLGTSTFPRCECYPTPSGAIVIRSIDDGSIIQTYGLGGWRRARTYDERGEVVDSCVARMPHHPLPTDVKPAPLASHVFDTAAILARMDGGR